MALGSGAVCYYLDKETSWTLGTIDTWNGKTADITTTRTEHDPAASAKGVVEEKIFVLREDILDEDVGDLLHLTLLHDSTLLHCLRTRYFKDLIYTNIGAIVVAINPFNFKIPHYMDDQMEGYLSEGPRIENHIPHSWATAHNTYFELQSMKKNQTILVSGESGAGKTEASKIVFKYLSAVASKSCGEAGKEGGEGIGAKINKCSPPLEAFGNAKTVRNDNSSRFGKFMKVKFAGDGSLTGAHITKYLLEKSRIISAMPGERCYHSFYLLCRADDTFRDSFGVTSTADYTSINTGKCTSNKDYDTLEEFDEVIASMKDIGVGEEKIKSIWSVVAGVLQIQNVTFKSIDGGEAVEIASGVEGVLVNIERNLKIDIEVFKKELVSTTMELLGEVVVKNLVQTQAIDGRDAFCKAMYDSLFSWFIEECNSVLDTPDDYGSTWIGLLDIFGFEDFESNSFEQFCINLANETLQNHYNTYIFLKDMDECRAEGIDVTSVSFPDNSPCISMVTSKTGILSLLDEQCAVGAGTDELFLGSIVQHHGANVFFEKKKLSKNEFVVHHYAGSVSYTVDGFLDKNRDTLKVGWKSMLRASTDPLLSRLIPVPAEREVRVTSGGYFKNQLNLLMDLINSTNPHWIRCIKPHPAKQPRRFHKLETMKQLSSAGVLGTVKIRKAGYPVRIPFEDFFASYKIIDVNSIVSDVPYSPEACSTLCTEVAKLDGVAAQIGKTRVFLKSEAYVELEMIKRTVLTSYAQTVQAYAKAYHALQAKLKGKLNAANGELIQGITKQVKKKLFFIAKEAEERRENDAEETAEWGAILRDYDYFCSTTLAELLAAEDRLLEEQRERDRIEAERIAKLEYERHVIERRKAEREEKRQEQQRKEKQLLHQLTALNKQKLAEVANEMEELRRRRKVTEAVQKKKAAQTRLDAQKEREHKHGKNSAVRTRHAANVKKIEEYREELHQQVIEKSNWSELLVSRSRVDMEQRQFIRGMATELRVSDGKARVNAQEQRFKRMTELKQSEDATRDFLRIQQLEEQRADVLNKQRLERIARVEKRREENAASAAIKASRSQLDRDQAKQRNEWDRLLDGEKRTKQERAYRRAAEVREEKKVLKGLEEKIQRGIALQQMDEAKEVTRAKSLPAECRARGPGGTHTADHTTSHVRLDNVATIEPSLHNRLMGSINTAAAGTLNDPSVSPRLGNNMFLGTELPRSSLHWVP